MRLIAIGCSAGGVEALKQILPTLPEDYNPSIVVVQHIGPQVHLTLAEFYGSICAIKVKEAEDKEPMERGTVYFAPASYHLMLDSDLTFALSVDPPVHFTRPSIDVFMESAAPIMKSKMTGIILTGANEDGARGLKLIQHFGGATIVQDPKTADFPTMPQSALEVSVTSSVMSLSDIAKHLRVLK